MNCMTIDDVLRGNVDVDEIERGQVEIAVEQGLTVRQTGETTYTVRSSSGNVYTVRFCGRMDDVRTWECNCPAGQHGRDCKHMEAVVRLNNAICDVTGFE